MLWWLPLLRSNILRPFGSYDPQSVPTIPRSFCPYDPQSVPTILSPSSPNNVVVAPFAVWLPPPCSYYFKVFLLMNDKILTGEWKSLHWQFRSCRNGAFSGPIDCRNTAVSVSRNCENGPKDFWIQNLLKWTTWFLDPEIVEMVDRSYVGECVIYPGPFKEVQYFRWKNLKPLTNLCTASSRKVDF